MPAVTNSYNRLGQLSILIWNGMTDALAYNLAGELLAEAYSGGPLAGLAVTNRYDQFLRRTNLAALEGNTPLCQQTFGFDAASRLQTVGDGHGDSATYSYLANSPLVSQITFAQNGTTAMTTTKQYDYVNRLAQIASQPGGTGVPPVSFNYAYNLANQRTQDKLADGSYWVYQYDALGQVISGTKYFYDGTLVPGQQFDYSFDTIGNRTQTQAGGDQSGGGLRLASYSVNNLNQIVSRDYPGTNDVIGAALANNAVTVNGQAAFHKWEYFRGTVGTNNANAPAWLTASVASGGSSNTGSLFVPQTREQFRYDADGNLLRDGRWNYTWDAENRLTGMTVNTTVGPQYQLTFAYDAKGRRMEKIVSLGNASTLNYQPATTNLFAYDGWKLIAELRTPNSAHRTYTWGSDVSGSMQGAGGVGGLLEVSYYGSATTNCFPAFDGNGNVAALVNAADGTTLANYEYGPFGEVIRATGPMARANPIRFSTKYDDDESDLLYYGYRYYKPSTGAWPNRDPIGEPGFNLVSERPKTDNELAWERKRASMKALEAVNQKLAKFLRSPEFQAAMNREGMLAHGENMSLYTFVDNNPESSIDARGLYRLSVPYLFFCPKSIRGSTCDLFVCYIEMPVGTLLPRWPIELAACLVKADAHMTAGCFAKNNTKFGEGCALAALCIHKWW